MPTPQSLCLNETVGWVCRTLKFPLRLLCVCHIVVLSTLRQRWCLPCFVPVLTFSQSSLLLSPLRLQKYLVCTFVCMLVLLNPYLFSNICWRYTWVCDGQLQWAGHILYLENINCNDCRSMTARLVARLQLLRDRSGLEVGWGKEMDRAQIAECGRWALFSYGLIDEWPLLPTVQHVGLSANSGHNFETKAFRRIRV